jgi:Restriction endonuclease
VPVPLDVDEPADTAPAGSGAVRRLRDRVVAASAECGFYISVRGFTPEAQHFADTAPFN